LILKHQSPVDFNSNNTNPAPFIAYTIPHLTMVSSLADHLQRIDHRRGSRGSVRKFHDLPSKSFSSNNGSNSNETLATEDCSVTSRLSCSFRPEDSVCFQDLDDLSVLEVSVVEEPEEETTSTSLTVTSVEVEEESPKQEDKTCATNTQSTVGEFVHARVTTFVHNIETMNYNFTRNLETIHLVLTGQ
jgi:hypothetical protein